MRTAHLHAWEENQTFAALKHKAKQGIGKIKRFILGHAAQAYVQQQERRRRGECRRCGACCRLLFACPFLQTLGDGNTRCRIHARRPRNCRIFPLDEACLRERDAVLPDRRCGYIFVRDGEHKAYDAFSDTVKIGDSNEPK